MILVLARGHYCPQEQQQHLQPRAFHSEIAVAYTRIVTISTDNIAVTCEFRASVGANWTFLSDAGHKIQKDLDIQEYTDPYHDPMVPHTLVLKPGLVIYSVYNGYWYWGRPSTEDLRRDLRAVTREIRPDWDLGRPGSAGRGRRATARTSSTMRTSNRACEPGSRVPACRSGGALRDRVIGSVRLAPVRGDLARTTSAHDRIREDQAHGRRKLPRRAALPRAARLGARR